MKSSLLFVSLLLFATSAQAQHSHTQPTTGSTTGPYSGNNQGYAGEIGARSAIGSRGRPLHYEAARDFSVGSAKNDGPFVPSTYMNYNDAVALGQQQLAGTEKSAEGDASASLGEIARAYRTVKVPTLRLQSRVIQDNSGRLEVCNLNGNDCHRP
jgi:hypothetical protein